MAIKDTFIRYVSHEIRSPLTTTSLGLHYLLNKLHLQHAAQESTVEMLDVVKETVVTCELALNTLNDFLMLDKIQSNMLEITTTARQASEFMLDAIGPFCLQVGFTSITPVSYITCVSGFLGKCEFVM